MQSWRQVQQQMLFSNNWEQPADGYTRDPLGITCSNSFDFRRKGKKDNIYDKPPTIRGGKFVDDEFPLEVAIDDEYGIEWKRPTEIMENPTLFVRGANRYDVGQGGDGTCWFLSVVACLADNESHLNQLIPEDAYSLEKGIFKCRFWRFGAWEEVHIDDRLPVVGGTSIWGARSKDDDNEVWVSLLEKAFARFHGSYDIVNGGMPGEAYLCMTGGCSEYIDFAKEGYDKKTLFSRLQNALRTGAIICTSCPARYDGYCGLIGDHVYAITGANKVRTQRGEIIYLVRMWNPWGEYEWTGAWRDDGPEWDLIPEGSLKHPNADEGEFYMDMDDYMKYFSNMTICSLTPDFDKDGCADTLDYTTNIFGEWRPSHGFHKRLMNPRFLFQFEGGTERDTLTAGNVDDGLVPLVVQIVQAAEDRLTDIHPIRVDLYKVHGEDEDSKNSTFVVELLGTRTNVYKKEQQMTMRYKVEPGEYIVVPSTCKEGVNKDFLIRVFAPCPLKNVREVPQRAVLMLTEVEEEHKAYMNHFVVQEPAPRKGREAFPCCQCLFGSWRQGFNAGGHVSRDTFHTNPQIHFTVLGEGKHLVTFSLMQSMSNGQKYPIGILLYQISKQQPVPADQNYLLNHYNSVPRSVNGQQGKYVIANSCTVTYLLDPGQYFIILHEKEPFQETDFALIAVSTCWLQLKAYHLGCRSTNNKR